jgi:hypothetical protein
LSFHAYRRSAPVEPNARLSAVSVEGSRLRLLHIGDQALADRVP